MSDDANPYDEFPYQSVALTETHPERFAAIATLFGLEPPPPESARVLEMGCAGGGNLLPMAASLPGASFVGVDLSPRQIEAASSAAEKVGARNVEFHARGLEEIGREEFGQFDYLICHGVYSWVPDAIRSAIFRVASETLAPNGIAYVSFNTLPGWHVPGMIREMMLYHVREIAGQAERVRAARQFLDFLSENIPDRDGHLARVLREEAMQLRPHADSYVAHEHLEERNDPIYFHQFVERAAGHGLKFLADARVWAMACSSQPPTAGVLDGLSRDPLAREQYHDFLTNRRFRRAMLVRDHHAIPAVPGLAGLKRLRASASVWPAVSPVDPSSRVPVEFRAADGSMRLSTTDAVFKASLVILTEVFPRSLPFDELWERTRERLVAAGVDISEHPDVLATRLLQAYAANSLELHSVEPPLPEEVSDRPEAIPAARLAAEGSHQVPNFRHRQTTLSDFDRLVIRELDGSATRAEVVERLVAKVAAGEFPITEHGLPLRDPTRLRPILERSLGPALQRLQRGALLVR